MALAHSVPRSHGTQIASVTSGVCMLTKSVWPSGLKAPPANSLSSQPDRMFFAKMIFWNKNDTLNQDCKVAVNPGSITC